MTDLRRGRAGPGARALSHRAGHGRRPRWRAHRLGDESIHLGSTLYGCRWWGTRVDPETRLLLLQHCFGHCGYGRVKVQTDVLNVRSWAAISQLGAVEEGVLRRDKRREDGTFRDPVVISVLATGWPGVEEVLQARLGRHPHALMIHRGP